MKKRNYLFVVGIGVALVLVLGISQGHAQRCKGEMAAKSVLVAAVVASQFGDVEVDYLDIDYLNQGGTKDYAGTRSPNTRYIAAATPNKDSSDVDLYVYDGNGRLITKDTKAEPVAAVEHTPAWRGSFTYRVQMYNGNDCFGFMIFNN